MLAAPLAMAFFLLLIACLAWAFGRLRVRNALVVVAVAIAYLGATVPVGDGLLAPLEDKYPPLRAVEALPKVDYVVVLGSGYAPHGEVPTTAALDEDGLVRIVEGVRLLKLLGSARLVVSGGASPGRSAPAQGYASLARSLGVSPTSLVVLDGPLDTAQEARAVAARLGGSPFLLVTSACHMPRAMAWMARAGAKAIPAPTGQLTGRPRDVGSWLPSAAGLGRSERAMHEYLGLVAVAAGVSD